MRVIVPHHHQDTIIMQAIALLSCRSLTKMLFPERKDKSELTLLSRLFTFKTGKFEKAVTSYVDEP